MKVHVTERGLQVALGVHCCAAQLRGAALSLIQAEAYAHKPQELQVALEPYLGMTLE